MRRTADILKAVCPVAAAVMIYMCIMKIVDGDENILLYILASVFSAALCVAVFIISALSERVNRLERIVRSITEDPYGEEEREPQVECPFCHAFIDADAEICPYCRNESSPRPEEAKFATDDPEYKGTDYSGEDYLSAYAPDEAEK